MHYVLKSFQCFHLTLSKAVIHKLLILPSKLSINFLLLCKFSRLKTTHIHYLTVSMVQVPGHSLSRFFVSDLARVKSWCWPGLWSYQWFSASYSLRLLAEFTSSSLVVVGLRSLFFFWLSEAERSVFLEITCNSLPCDILYRPSDNLIACFFKASYGEVESLVC